MEKKNFHILIVVLTFYSCGTNRLHGVYCHSFNSGFNASCLTFKKERRFSYESSGDLGINLTGKGNYTLKDKILQLKFDKDSVNNKSKVEIKNWSFRDNEKADSVDLIFKVYDGYNKELPLHAATIYEESENFKFSEKNNLNPTGALTVTKPTGSKTESYKIGYLGYETVNISLKHDSTKEISVVLYPAQPQKISDTTLIYVLDKTGRNFFITSKDAVYQKQDE